MKSKLPRLSQPLVECIGSNGVLFSQNIILLLTFLLYYQLLISVLQQFTPLICQCQ